MRSSESFSRGVPYVSLVIPVFNEEDNLRGLDAELRTIGEELGAPYEIIYVDDRSSDSSFEVLSELAHSVAEDGVPTQVVRLRRNFGQTAAMAAGFHLARGEIVVAMDADGQNNPADVPRLVARLESGFDVVSGWRRRRSDGGWRVQLSRVANLLIRWVSGVPVHDTGCTLKAYRLSMLQEIHLYGEMHRFIPIYLARQGARITEVEVDHRPRRAGESKYGNERILKVMLDLIMLLFISRYLTRPMHFFGQVGFFFGVCCFVVSALMVIFRFGWLGLIGIPYQADFIETPLPALSATFLAAMISALMFGVLGELAVRIYFEFEGRLPFAIENVQQGGPQGAIEGAPQEPGSA